MTARPDDQLRPPPTRPAALRPLLLRLHFYAGVFVGPFIVIAAVTGLLYALIPQIDAAVFHHELTVEKVSGRQLPLADQIAAARAAHPEGAVVSIRPPAAPDETTQINLAVDDVPPDYGRTVFVDPYSGDVRGALSTYGQWLPVRAWFDELHRNLHLGAVGRNYSELAASWLWVISLAGLALWIGQRRKAGLLRRLASPDREARGRRRTVSWHGAVGVWILVAALGLSVTGITWSRYGGESVNLVQERLDTRAPSVDTTLGEHHHAAMAMANGDIELGDADTVWTTARQAGLSGPIWIYPPSEPGQGWRVAENKRDWPTRYDAISVDPATGEITDRVDFAQWPFLAKLTDWAIGAHMGILFGITNQLLLALAAIGLITVVVRGYLMWWQRRPTRGSQWAVGRPPLRGALRQLPLWASAGVLVAALAVGWFLPVFGVSLIAFLVIDTVVAAVKRGRFMRIRFNSRRTTPEP